MLRTWKTGCHLLKTQTLRAMRIKVCGLRDKDNIEAVLGLKPDYYGMIFYKPSKRYVGIDPPDVNPQSAGSAKSVGVFVNAGLEEISSRVLKFHLSMVQLHGDESPEYIRRLRSLLGSDIGVIKAISVRQESDLKRAKDYEGVADMLLFDTPTAGYGGSGEQFSWSVLRAYDGSLPYLLSGGIGPDDAGRLASLNLKNMVGVDINSRFETAPAIKDIGKLGLFIEKLRKLKSKNQQTL